MKLSVVIPVYRVEDTLDHCLESVLQQNVDDMEVILVDDGSPDQCPQMCDTWANKDARISVIHKKNGGLSDARNAGIDIAKGEYITFVDSDDFVGKNSYAQLLHILDNNAEVDILEYPAFVFYNSPKQHLLDLASDKIYTDMDEYWYEGCAYNHTYAWNKIYRRKLFDSVRYPVGVVFEDVHTLPRLLKECKSVMTTNQGLYYYCLNRYGITNTSDGRALKMLLEPHVDIIRKSVRRDSAFYNYYIHVLNIQMDVYEQTGEDPILPYIHIDNNCLKGTHKLKAILLNIFGTKKLCKINKYIHKVWRNR